MTQNELWHLVDLLGQRTSRVEEGVWVSIGSHSSCDVVVRGHPVREALMVQATCEDGFVFLSDGMRAWAHPFSWKYLGCHTQFFFECQSHPIKSVRDGMHEQEVGEVFEHPLLKQALWDLQSKYLAEDAEPQGLGVLRDAAIELGRRFWEEHDVSNAAQRLLFRKLVWGIYAHVREMGPLTHIMADPTVTEIMVVAHDEIFVERFGRIEQSQIRFSSPEDLRTLVERAVSKAGRRIDESCPTCDFRWPDGARVHAAIPPVALRGPTLTVRRFSERMFSPAEFVSNGTLTHDMLTFLRDAVRCKRNILISGGTGSGKTTLLNLVAQFVSESERIITIEDTAELRILHNHVVRLEARPCNTEGVGEISLRELVRNALRMRPDRIIVGECRGPEALDMLQAMNTGHEGSLGTIHANSPQDALRRLETLVMFAACDLPLKAVREQVVAGVHCVVQMEKREGTRRVAAIHKVLPLCDGNYSTQVLYGRGYGACS